MMEIGRKIYFDKSSGIILLETGERMGDVRDTTMSEDFTSYPQLIGKDPTQIDFLQLLYGERSSEFANMGSMHVDPTTKVLTIYPRLTISTDKAQITSDGIDTASVTATTGGPDPVTFSVNGIDQIPAITPANGVATFQFATTLTGSFIIAARTALNGQNSVIIRGV